MPRPDQTPAAAAHPGSRHGPVLLCDDDEVSRLLLAHMLTRHGFQELLTSDGAAALALWPAGGVGALVTDMNMAGVSGEQLIGAIRAAERLPAAIAPGSAADSATDTTTDDFETSAENKRPLAAQRTPIVVCSGSLLPAAMLANVARLHDAYFLKPVDIDPLVQTLRSLGQQPGLTDRTGP